MDEVSITDPTFSSLHSLPDNIHLICCLSPTQGKKSDKLYNPEQLGLPTQPDVYCAHLATCYRNNYHIQQFIQLWASEVMKSGHYVLSDKPATSPPPLDRSSHPVVWLDCRQRIDYDDGDKIMLAMVNTAKTWWEDCTVQGIADLYTGSDSVDSEYCAGTEADVVIIMDRSYTATQYRNEANEQGPPPALLSYYYRY